MQRHRPVSRLHFLLESCLGTIPRHNFCKSEESSEPHKAVYKLLCGPEKSNFNATANFPSNIHPPNSGSAQDGSTHRWSVIVHYCRALLKRKKGVSAQSKSVPRNKAPIHVTLMFQHAQPLSCVSALAHGPRFLSLGQIHGDHRSSNPEKAPPSSSFPPPSALPLWHPIKHFL